jgi:hypothetical protein
MFYYFMGFYEHTTFMEVASGAWFSGWALLAHWAFTKLYPMPGASS